MEISKHEPPKRHQNLVQHQLGSWGDTDDMRTTVNLDADAYHFAHAYAGGRGITFSSAVSELIRRAERAPEGMQTGRLRINEQGRLVVARTGNSITPEMVKQASEDELL